MLSVTGDDPILPSGVQFDRQRGVVHFDGKAIRLTPTEFQLLWALATNPGRAFTRRELLVLTRGSDSPSTERTIDVHIRSVRRKLGDRSRWIVTIRGLGYRLRAEQSPDQQDNSFL